MQNLIQPTFDPTSSANYHGVCRLCQEAMSDDQIELGLSRFDMGSVIGRYTHKSLIAATYSYKYWINTSTRISIYV
jgi:hypothetical protein